MIVKTFTTFKMGRRIASPSTFRSGVIRYFRRAIVFDAVQPGLALKPLCNRPWCGLE